MERRLGRICSCFQVGFLDEVAPALVPIRGILSILKLFQLQFCILLALHYCYYPGGAVGADVVPNDGKGGGEVVGCQKESVS